MNFVLTIFLYCFAIHESVTIRKMFSQGNPAFLTLTQIYQKRPVHNKNVTVF